MNQQILKFFAVLVAYIFYQNNNYSDLIAQTTYRTVALTGQSPPGSSEIFTRFTFDGSSPQILDSQWDFSPVLNAKGDVAFSAFSTPNGISTTSGVWKESAGQLTNFTPGTPAYQTARIVLNNNGDVSFSADSLSGSTFGPSGIVNSIAGQLYIATKELDQAPGTPVGATFNGMGYGAFNNLGQIAFFSNLQPGSGGVIANVNNEGIWSDIRGPLSLIARRGSQVPGLAAGTLFAGLGDPALSSSGNLVFRASLKVGTGDATNDNSQGLWLATPTATTLVVRDGDLALGSSSDARFKLVSSPIMNQAGDIAFGSIITGSGVTLNNDGAIWLKNQSGTSLVAREGDIAPGTNKAFIAFNKIAMNASGKIAFSADAGNVSDGGIWSNASSTLSAIVVQGDHAPGTPIGISFGDFPGIDPKSTPVMNDLGHVAFLAKLTGTGITSSNEYGLWAQDGYGDLTLVARMGDSFPISDTEQRTISRINFYSASSGDDGYGMAFNNQGKIAFSLAFTDGSSGIFTTTLIPEPSSWVVIFCGAMGICFFAMRRNKVPL